MVPGESSSSPHHFVHTRSLEAGGPMLYSQVMADTHTFTYALSGPWTRGGREVCTVVSSCLPAAAFQKFLLSAQNFAIGENFSLPSTLVVYGKTVIVQNAGRALFRMWSLYTPRKATFFLPPVFPSIFHTAYTYTQPRLQSSASTTAWRVTASARRPGGCERFLKNSRATFALTDVARRWPIKTRKIY